jgi:hypothetical protein
MHVARIGSLQTKNIKNQLLLRAMIIVQAEIHESK